MRTPFLKLLASSAWALAAFTTIANAEATSSGAAVPAQKARVGKADWRAALRAMLPEAGLGKGDGRVTKSELVEHTRKTSDCLGAGRIEFADDLNVSVYYLRAPWKASDDQAILALDIITLSTPLSDTGKRSWFQVFGKSGNLPLACVRRPKGADKVVVFCGIADPEAPFLLTTSAEYMGLAKEEPKSGIIERLVGRLRLARLLLAESE